MAPLQAVCAATPGLSLRLACTQQVHRTDCVQRTTQQQQGTTYQQAWLSIEKGPHSPS